MGGEAARVHKRLAKRKGPSRSARLTIAEQADAVHASVSTASVQRFAGTAVGAVVGAATSMMFPGSIALFVLDLWAVGLLGTVLPIDHSAHRYAGVTLAIVMIVPRPASPWLIAMHRFCEVSIGIAVSLAVSALRPERPESTQGSSRLLGI